MTRDRALTPRWLAREELPACVLEVEKPPRGVWVLGDPALLTFAPDRCVAIVGTRHSSEYGQRTAKRLGAAAARAGLVVVSGLARGIDSAAHEGALSAGGLTVAVMGTGVDIPYPATNRRLHEQILDTGLAISEFEPGQPAYRGSFPQRNRLIAGLCQVTVVVEAPFKSGAMNTAAHALQMGRLVAGVPGPIDEPRSAGVNHLMRDGAQILASVDDLLGFYGLSTKTRGTFENGDPAGELVAAKFSETDRAILAVLGGRRLPADDIAFGLGLSVRQVSESLLKLELVGAVNGDGAGYRRVEA